MKNLILASTAVFLASCNLSLATAPSFDEGIVQVPDGPAISYVREAKKGSGSDGGGNDDGPDHDSNDDNGGDRDDDSSDDRPSASSKDDNNVSGSNRRKKRIPNGSGCDDAGDVAEHPECSAQP